MDFYFLTDLKYLQELELDPRLISDGGDLIPNGVLDDTATMAWRDRHEHLYKWSTVMMARHCPTLRQVIWGFGFPFIVWRGIITSKSLIEMDEVDESAIEMRLERLSRSGETRKILVADAL